MQAPPSAPQARSGGAPTSIDRAFARIYNFDFAGAHAFLDDNARRDPGDPLTYSVRAAVYLFAELHRLKILETQFFLDDDKLVDGRRLKPDATVRARLFGAVAEARRIAEVRVARDPDDRDGLFALCMSAGVVTDYTALVERRQWRSLGLARETKKYADRLLALDPPFYDAYHTYGTLNYVVGSLPFFVRWFVRYDRIEGDKRRAVEQLQLVVAHGRYYGPFARILLAVIALREGRPGDAEKLLAGLSREFPENPLLKAETARAAGLARRQRTR